MDLATLKLLCTTDGSAVLAEAVALAPDDSTFLSCAKRLNKRYPADLVRGALQTAVLRQRGRAKFSRADRMFFTREALEQSSHEVVAQNSARRFAGLGLVGDFCCGIGGDAIALAGRGPIVAVDVDPLRLAMAGHNLEAHDLRQGIELVHADVLTMDLPPLAGLFVDPDRRTGGRRQLSIAACSPPLEGLRARLPRDLPLGVKLAPGVNLEQLVPYRGEVEFVSLECELKECLLWLGPLRTAARRATLLPGRQTLFAEAPAPALPPRPVGWFLYDPDPAVVRSGLVADLALRLGAWPIDASIAYLSANERIETPLARCFAVEVPLPFHLRRLQECLRQRGVGRIVVSRRGSAVEPDELVRRLKLSGSEVRTVILTRVQGQPYALVARPAT
jgi:hypothetical protein